MRAALPALLALLALASPALAQAPETPAYEYHTYATLQADLEALAAAHPERARLSSIGQSATGLELWSLEIGLLDDPAYAAKPGFYLDGGHHGNEALGIEAAFLFAEWLLASYGEDANATAMVDGARIHVTPLVNPDGKTLNTRTNGNLVNLNRNYPFHWDERGTDPAPGGGNYAGPSAGSEPETQANMAFIDANDLDVYVTLHTGSYDIVRPFGYSPDATVPDEDLYQRLFAYAEQEAGLASRWPGGSGESLCWAYGARGIFAFLLEVHEFDVRPEGSPQLLLGPLTKEEVLAGLEPHFAVLRHVLANAGRWGGALEAGIEDVQGGRGTLVVENRGFGPAANITLAGTGLAAEGALPASLAPGASARVPVRLDGPSQALLRYDRLAVVPEDGQPSQASAEARVEARTGSIEPRAAPGAEALAPLAALAVALAARRRAG